jgi:hypothetical protein
MGEKNRIVRLKPSASKENSSSKQTCKLDKFWAADSKSLFSFSPTRMVFEMWWGVWLFEMGGGAEVWLFLYENWIESFNLFT